MNTAPRSLWEAAAILGEGVLWDAARGLVWFVDIKGRRPRDRSGGCGGP